MSRFKTGSSQEFYKTPSNESISSEKSSPNFELLSNSASFRSKIPVAIRGVRRSTTTSTYEFPFQISSSTTVYMESQDDISGFKSPKKDEKSKNKVPPEGPKGKDKRTWRLNDQVVEEPSSSSRHMASFPESRSYVSSTAGGKSRRASASEVKSGRAYTPEIKSKRAPASGDKSRRAPASEDKSRRASSPEVKSSRTSSPEVKSSRTSTPLSRISRKFPRISRTKEDDSKLKEGSTFFEKDLSPIKEETRDEFNAELYHTSPRHFRPRLYNFTNPKHAYPKGTFYVLSPPFWVLVDHLIAVVWYLYSGEKREKVGIVHLQWALEFTKWIRDTKGDRSGVMASLINVFQDLIYERREALAEPTKEPSDDDRYKDPFILHSKDDDLTSITLKDVLARNSGLPEQCLSSKVTCGGRPYKEEKFPLHHSPGHSTKVSFQSAASSFESSLPKPIFFPKSTDPSILRECEIDNQTLVDQEKLLSFLEKVRGNQAEKKREEIKVKDLDDAINALKEGNKTFGEWLQEHFK